MPRRILILPLLVVLLTPALALADCTNFVKHNDNDNYYPDEDYDPSAHAYAKIDLSRIYGDDCTDNPYKSYAKVRVSCEGYSKTQGPLYLYRLGPNADWDDAKNEISCNKWGCVGYDKYFSSGTHIITLRKENGDMESAFFVCYDYDENPDYWAWAWTGWGFYGKRTVFTSHSYKQCSGGDVYWYDSMDRKEDKYEDCGSDGCDDWGAKYCFGSKIKQDRTCYDRGCENSRCYETTEKDTRTLETCKLGCYNGECQNDRDNDGVIDRGDECPNEAGSGSNGCPTVIETVVHILFGWAGLSGWTI